MAKITYTKLGLKTNTETKKIEFNGNEIEILQYLPIEDKYSLVNITLQECQEGTIYNPVKKDMFFHLNLAFMYTNISFTDKQKSVENLSKVYDALTNSGLMQQILDNIPKDEYDELYSYIEELEYKILNYNNTLSGTIKNIIDTLPANAEQMQKIVDNFDPQKFQNVLDFAKAANGGRPIE